MTPELEIAIEASRRRVATCIKNNYPDATLVEIRREHDFGESFNYVPRLFGSKVNTLTDFDGETDLGWTDLFYELCEDDLDAWLNNAELGWDLLYFFLEKKYDKNSGTYYWDLIQRDSFHPPVLRETTQFSYGIYFEEREDFDGKTIQDALGYFSTKWPMTGNVIATTHINGEDTESANDYVIQKGDVINFYRRLAEH